MRKTLKCHECKEEFRREEMVQYSSPNSNTAYWYCVNCLQEKKNRDAFSTKVCDIFGLKTPGPRIWSERKRLRDNYGYTDQTIVDCLDYIYNVESKKKLSESLYLVSPPMVDKMLKYKRMRESQGDSFVNAIKTQMVENLVLINEESTKKRAQLNPDDWLED